jgi:hypothetical protein
VPEKTGPSIHRTVFDPPDFHLFLISIEFPKRNRRTAGYRNWKGAKIK